MAVDDGGQSNNTVGVKDGSENPSETIQIRIKMLDSSTHTIHVKKDVGIPALKEQLTSVVGVPAQQQRLIFRGKVLKDDQLLSSYNVEDGDSLHLVARQNVESSTVSGEGVTNSQDNQDPASMPTRGRPTQATHSMVLGTINITNAGDGGLPDLNRIVSAVLNSVGSGNASFENASNIGVTMGGSPPNIHATGPARFPRPQDSNGEQPPQIAVNNVPTQMTMEVVPDALETLSLFLNRVHDNFVANGFVRDETFHLSRQLHTTVQSATSDADNIGQIPSATPRQTLTPAALGNIIRRVQDVFTTQASAAFARLSGQLENETALTDGAARGEVQSSAVWTGNMMQQLGALLMELGRTTLTLRMGQSPAEAVVNSGPAVFISPAGPNPIMVQPHPFQAGFPFGDFRLQVPQAIPGMVRPPSMNGVGPRGVNIHINARDLGSVLASGSLPSNMQLPSHILAGLAASGFSPHNPEPPQTAQAEGAEQNPAGPQNGSHVEVPNQPQVDNAAPNLQVLPGVVQGAVMIIQENGASRVVPIRPRPTGVPNNLIPPVGAEPRMSSGGIFNPMNAIFQQQMGPTQISTQLRPIQPGTFYTQATNPIASQGAVPVSVQHQAMGAQSARPVGITITLPLHFTSQMAGQQSQPSQTQQTVTSTPGVESASQTTELPVHSTDTLTRQVNNSDTGGDPSIEATSGLDFQTASTGIIERMHSGTFEIQQVDISSEIAGDKHVDTESAGNSQATSERSQFSSDGLQNCVSEQSKLPLEEKNSKGKGLESGEADVIPAGLGLGSLPPLPLKASRRSKMKPQEPQHAEQTKAAESSISSSDGKEPAVSFGRRVDDSKVQSSERGKGSARLEENSTSESSSKNVLQGMASLLDGFKNNEGMSTGISGPEQLAPNPFPNITLHGLNRDGEQAPDFSNVFGSMMGQLMRNPGMGTFVNQVAQSMGEAPNSASAENAELGDMLGGLDIASMLQQTLPLMSQLFGGASPVGLSAQSSLPAGEVELDHVAHPQLDNSRAAPGESSQTKLEEIAEKIQSGERPEDIFRSVAENAAEGVLRSSSSNEVADLAGALAQTTGLSDAYMSLLCKDLAMRLATEVHQSDVSQLETRQLRGSMSSKQGDRENESP